MPYLMISFNDMLTNDIVSFEQLDLGVFLTPARTHVLSSSLEAPSRCASNENPQHMSSWRNKKKILT